MTIQIDSRVDDYIQQSAAFAHPILRHIRALLHRHCAEAEETIKWGMPHFMYQGSILCHMAAFKQHCSLGFWLAHLLEIDTKHGSAMGQFGRITSITDLPSEQAFADLIQKAQGLIKEGHKRNVGKGQAANPISLVIPPTFLDALQANPKAYDCFKHFSYTNQKDYVDWYSEAKTEATRQKRLIQSIEWLTEGKRRNWKYEKSS